jgi:hypothetical protein
LGDALSETSISYKEKDGQGKESHFQVVCANVIILSKFIILLAGINRNFNSPCWVRNHPISLFSYFIKKEAK